MITEPVIKKRPSSPYVAVCQIVSLPFDDQVPAILENLFSQLSSQGFTPTGPVFFKHNVIDMPKIEMEFGVPVAELATASGTLITGTLPAGNYGEVTHFGPYDGVMEANSRLVGWANDNGIEWDSHIEADGEHFACRLEIYTNGPDDEPNPDKLETIIAIKIAD